MDDFYGIWVREPTDTLGPERAVCAMWPVPGGLAFAMGWTEAGGQPQQVGFTLPADGTAQDLADGRQLRCALVDGALVTEVLAEGRVVARSARRLVAGGTALDIHQLEDGVETTDRYRKGRVKQVLCYRRDLKMRKGKIAAQCAHASLAVLLRTGRSHGLSMTVQQTPEMALWMGHRFAKIVLSVEDEASLVRVHELAKERGVPTALIRDAGLTEFGGVPTLTTVAVGPALDTEIDAITGRDGLVPTKLA